MVENLDWKDDLKFLFQLCKVSVSLKNGTYRATLRKLPSLHNAMWTSRHIYIDL